MVTSSRTQPSKAPPAKASSRTTRALSSGALAGAPGGCICLRFRKAARRVSQIYDHHLEPYGVTITQYGLLGQLKAHEGIGIGAMATLLVMDPTTLTRNLRPLERQGLITFVQDGQDRRQRNLFLTDAGRETLKRARPGWEAAQRAIAGVLGETDGPQIAIMIDRMLDKLAE